MKHERPFKQRYYPRNPAMQEIIDKEIDELLAQDRIEPSNSPYSSPIVLVKKKQGGWRLCIDYRVLNEQSVKDAYPLPQINYILDKLKGAQYISTIDLKNGYWQIPLALDSRAYTAFTVPGRGLFQWKVMPFGHHSAPATFQRVLDRVIGPEIEPFAFAYLDDIIVVSKSYEQHIAHLTEVFNRLIQANLRINPDKCEFFKTEIKYLGHMVSRNGIHTDPDKVKAIRELKPPSNVKELRRFLGIASWYRRFVSSFSMLAAPLNKLLKKNKKWQWDEPQQQAFEEIKQKLTEAPVLACPDFAETFILQTDASYDGLGVVLYQQLNEQEKVIAYASRTLNTAEQKYSVTEKECLAVVWGIRKMRPYLEGYHFVVVTDHQALKWLNSMENPSGRLARWALELQQFDFEIKYRKGKYNVVADALSRQPLPLTNEAEVCKIQSQPSSTWYVRQMNAVKERPKDHPDYTIKEDKLYRRFLSNSIDDTGPPWKLCIDKDQKLQVLKENHDDVTSGHLGIRKTTARIMKFYYWPGMCRDIAKYVRSCKSCTEYKPSQRIVAGKMSSTFANRPWQIVSSDFIGPLPRSKKGNTMILVFHDKFTKWTEFTAVRDATTPVLIKAFKDRIIARNGCPEVFISDNGTQYTSHKFRKLLEVYSIKHQLTPPYTPQANPTERMNRIIKTMVAQYIQQDQREWDEYLPELMLALNTSQSESTGYTPAYLNYGREIILPASLYSKTGNQQEQSEPPETIHQRLKEIYQLVRINMRRATTKQQHHYNLRRREWIPKIGELVMRKERPLSSKIQNQNAKLSAKYSGPYKIKRMITPTIFELAREDGKLIGNTHVKDLKECHVRKIAEPISENYKTECGQQKLSVVKMNSAVKEQLLKAVNKVEKQMEMEKQKKIRINKIVIPPPENDPCVRKRTIPRQVTSTPASAKQAPTATTSKQQASIKGPKRITTGKIKRSQEPHMLIRAKQMHRLHQQIRGLQIQGKEQSTSSAPTPSTSKTATTIRRIITTPTTNKLVDQQSTAISSKQTTATPAATKTTTTAQTTAEQTINTLGRTTATTPSPEQRTPQASTTHQTETKAEQSVPQNIIQHILPKLKNSTTRKQIFKYQGQAIRVTRRPNGTILLRGKCWKHEEKPGKGNDI